MSPIGHEPTIILRCVTSHIRFENFFSKLYGINDRHIVRYTFSGRSARPYIESNADAEELLIIAEEALNRYIPVDARERVQFVSQRMLTGLCAYTHNYQDFFGSIQSQLETLPGLEITGDYINGASIEACFQAGKACVEKVLRWRTAIVQREQIAQGVLIHQ